MSLLTERTKLSDLREAEMHKIIFSKDQTIAAFERDSAEKEAMVEKLAKETVTSLEELQAKLDEASTSADNRCRLVEESASAAAATREDEINQLRAEIATREGDAVSLAKTELSRQIKAGQHCHVLEEAVLAKEAENVQLKLQLQKVEEEAQKKRTLATDLESQLLDNKKLAGGTINSLREKTKLSGKLLGERDSEIEGLICSLNHAEINLSNKSGELEQTIEQHDAHVVGLCAEKDQLVGQMGALQQVTDTLVTSNNTLQQQVLMFKRSLGDHEGRLDLATKRHAEMAAETKVPYMYFVHMCTHTYTSFIPSFLPSY